MSWTGPAEAKGSWTGPKAGEVKGELDGTSGGPG